MASLRHKQDIIYNNVPVASAMEISHTNGGSSDVILCLLLSESQGSQWEKKNTWKLQKFIKKNFVSIWSLKNIL